MTDQLIDEGTLAVVKERLSRQGYLDSARRLCKEEPDLHYELNQCGINALYGVDGVSLEAQEAAHRAVWNAAMMTLEAYRAAFYKLWEETELGGRFKAMDPQLGAGSEGDEGRPEGKASPEDDRAAE